MFKYKLRLLNILQCVGHPPHERSQELSQKIQEKNAVNQISFLSAFFALVHEFIYFATDNATQKELTLIRARYPNVEGVLSYVHNIWKGAAMEHSISVPSDS